MLHSSPHQSQLFFIQIPKVLAYSFPQCEPVELLATVDVLRRAGIHVDIYGKTQIQECGLNIKIVTDIQNIKNKEQYDMLLFPGGPGYPEFVKDMQAKELAEYFLKNKQVAAICATPGYVLGHWNLIQGCELPEKQRNYTYHKGARVMVDGNLISAEGPDCSFEFGLKIIEVLIGEEKSKQIGHGIIYN